MGQWDLPLGVQWNSRRAFPEHAVATHASVQVSLSLGRQHRTFPQVSESLVGGAEDFVGEKNPGISLQAAQSLLGPRQNQRTLCKLVGQCDDLRGTFQESELSSRGWAVSGETEACSKGCRNSLSPQRGDSSPQNSSKETVSLPQVHFPFILSTLLDYISQLPLQLCVTVH